jgi:hypothetical protein
VTQAAVLANEVFSERFPEGVIGLSNQVARKSYSDIVRAIGIRTSSGAGKPRYCMYSGVSSIPKGNDQVLDHQYS